MNFARELTIPLQPMITIEGTHQGRSIVLPEDLLLAIDAWWHISNDEEAERVGKVIQERIDTLYGKGKE